MANLTSTAPAAFNAVFGLLEAAGEAQTPPVAVFHTELVQYEPESYVILTGIDNHTFEWSALGSFAFEEDYDIVGYASVFQGDVDPQTVLTNTYALFQNVVQATIVGNRNPPINAPLQSAGVTRIIPHYARYSGSVASMTDGPAGFAGKVDFAFSIHARVTVG